MDAAVKAKKPPCALKPGGTFVCKCGEEETLGGYVAAHWDMELIYTCPECNVRYSVVKGYVEEIK